MLPLQPEFQPKELFKWQSFVFIYIFLHGVGEGAARKAPTTFLYMLVIPVFMILMFENKSSYDKISNFE